MIDMKRYRNIIAGCNRLKDTISLHPYQLEELLDALEAAEKEKNLLLDVYRDAKRLEKYCVPCPEADDLLDSITHYEKYK